MANVILKYDNSPGTVDYNVTCIVTKRFAKI